MSKEEYGKYYARQRNIKPEKLPDKPPKKKRELLKKLIGFFTSNTTSPEPEKQIFREENDDYIEQGFNVLNNLLNNEYQYVKFKGILEIIPSLKLRTNTLIACLNLIDKNREVPLENISVALENLVTNQLSSPESEMPINKIQEFIIKYVNSISNY